MEEPESKSNVRKRDINWVSLSTCKYVLYSMSFSVPLCSSPMWGSALVTVSPSSWSTSLRKVEEIVYLCLPWNFFTWAHREPRGAGAQSWAEHSSQTSQAAGIDQSLVEAAEKEGDVKWNLKSLLRQLLIFTNLRIILLLGDVQRMVRAKLSSRKPNNY